MKKIIELSKKHQRFIAFTESAAHDADRVFRVRIAALIVYKNYPLVIGYNTFKSHPLQKQYGKHDEAIYLHAEIDAIRKALNLISAAELTQCSLYIIRVTANYGSKANAKPCVGSHGGGCDMAIRAFGFKETIYSIDDDHVGFL